MRHDMAAKLVDQGEEHNYLAKITRAENELWASIQSKGILHTDVQELYRKARTAYESVILNESEVIKLQEVEYALWKLHYKHIDEFRKRLKRNSANAESPSLVEEFKYFLSEASEFYKDLNTKFRKRCGLPEGIFLHKMDGNSSFVELRHLDHYLYVSHRFSICLGDLSRYGELLSQKQDNHKWTVAATYYFEAALVCLDCGNPHNQLALLATYIGDDLLALYHSVRSMAVKEPFPDAWNNITLVFEKNMSCKLRLLSTERQSDFLKPLERGSLLIKTHSTSSSSKGKLEVTEFSRNGNANLWSLFVRIASFFLTGSSLDDFPCIFASILSEFEALFGLDDTELEASLEAYEQFGLTRKGPYRALQAVSILIFIIGYLGKSSDLKAKTELLWTCTFTFLGRFLERCLKGNNSVGCCPLLPAVLVFVEWFVSTTGKQELPDEVSDARSFFFDVLVDLLNELHVEGEVKSSFHPALWEDYELRGFTPTTSLRESDFSFHTENMGNYRNGNSSRSHRLLLAGIKIADKCHTPSSWISYNRLTRKFSATDSVSPLESQCTNASPSVVEDEEVILFNPITRYNSAPVNSFFKNDLPSNESAPSDEILRRVNSLSIDQHEALPDLLDYRVDVSNFRHNNKPYAAGPPSLSGWVLNKESFNVGRGNGTKVNLNKPELTPIEEIPSVSISGATDSPYVAPVPSAPLLPEDPVWQRGNTSTSFGSQIQEEHGILGAPPVCGFSNLSPNVRPFGLSQPMSSSEWLYHYTNNLNHDRWGNPLVSNRVVHYELPYLYPGPPLVYLPDDQRREKLFHEYQRPGYNGYGGVSDPRADQAALLQYLKEREWQLQRESLLRGPTYMGN